MPTVRIASQGDADEVGRVLADGFSEDPVISWVFEEPDREGKLGTVFGFLAGEAHVPLGATYVLPGSCASWTPPDTPDWPREPQRAFRGAARARTCTAAEIERYGLLGAVADEHHPKDPHSYLGTIATVA